MSVEAKNDHQQSKRLPGSKPLRESRIERNGIKAGSIAPQFTLPDIYGRSLSLEQYRGRRVVLIFSHPRCGPCTQLAPYLARMYRGRGPIMTEIVVVSHGEIEENRTKAEAHGFEFPVVIQDRWKVSRKYGIFATPVAFLIGEDGRTTRDVAVGFDQVRNLVRDEFAEGTIDRFKDTVEDISGVLASPMPRRQAFRTAVLMAAGAFLSAIGIPETALAACGVNLTQCPPNTGTLCCTSTESCCTYGSTNACCPTGVICCFGKCCPAGWICPPNTRVCTQVETPH